MTTTESHTPDDKYHWVGAIETATGNTADILNFTSDMVDLEDISQSISLICRYNGHIPSFYSVAEHSVRVSLWLKYEGYSPEVQLTGLLHDAAEAYVGDMVRPLKRVPEVGGKHQELEEHIERTIHDVLGGIFPHPEEVKEADMQIYYWEVASIRSGLEVGWSWQDAKDIWLSRYYSLIREIRHAQRHS